MFRVTLTIILKVNISNSPHNFFRLSNLHWIVFWLMFHNWVTTSRFAVFIYVTLWQYHLVWGCGDTDPCWIESKHYFTLQQKWNFKLHHKSRKSLNHSNYGKLVKKKSMSNHRILYSFGNPLMNNLYLKRSSSIKIYLV